MGKPLRRPEKIFREGRSYHLQGELWIRRKRYSILQQLGSTHRQRLLLDDPSSRQLRVALVLPSDSSTVQHLQVLRRLPQLAELPQILDYERQGENTLILLSWVRGIDLGHYLAQIKRGQVRPPLPYESVRLIRGLAHALLRLNQHAQIVHADIKPQNLIITRKTSRLVMIDYGSAWPIAKTLYRVPGDGRSPVYAAPEIQADEPQLPSLADQFSATLILYQLLTGEIPYSALGGQAGRPGYQSAFAGETPSVLRLSPAVQRLPVAIGAALDAVIVRGLQLNPQDRFPTTSAWVDALERVFLQMKLLESGQLPQRGAWERFLDAVADRWFKE